MPNDRSNDTDVRPTLVTGSSGFVGARLARRLHRAGWNTITLDVKGAPDLCMDVADSRVLRDVAQARYRAVVHQAGLSNSLEQDEELLREQNTVKPLALAHACAISDTPFIYASSFSVYGATARRAVSECDVKLSSGPLNPYAWSKLRLDEEMSLRYSGGDWMGLRYTNVFGPSEPTEGRIASVISHWLKSSAHGEPIHIFEGTEESGRDFVEVDRITSVILRRLTDPAPPRGVFNLGSGVTTTFSELIQWCREFAGKPIQVRTVPFTIAHQYQHWTCVDMSALAKFYPRLVIADRNALKEYARKCWKSHL